ncbi:MAG TPA: class IV adenylate cyclase [Bryobacteraceae bacterium]|nr:class IV adenylate cyclase [Bryobacteraceae bacterium]
MARETEIKLRIADLAGFRRALAKLGARRVARGGARVHERNILFDTPTKRLKRRSQLLRIRTEAPAAREKGRKRTQQVLLTFKGPVGTDENCGAHKVREELELQVSDGGALTSIFRGLGMQPWFRYEKFRTTYRLPKSQRWAKGLLIELDETPIGTFVELEGPARAIDLAAKALGFSKRDYIIADYFVLYREQCRRRGENPGDMLFSKKNRRR